MKKSFPILMLFILCISVQAQVDLPAEEVEVVKDYEVTIKEGQRIKTMPESYAIPAQVFNYEYDLNIQPSDISYPSPYIRPVAMKPDRDAKEYNGFLKASYGTLNNPAVSAQYDLVSEDYYTLGIRGDYESMEDSSIENKKYGKTYFDVHADYFITKERKVSIKIGADLQDFHAFGFNHIDSVSQNLDKGTRTDIFFNAGYAYDNASSPFGYGFNFSYDRISAALSNDEENDIGFKLFATSQLKDFGLLGINAGLQYANLTGFESQNDLLIYVNPSISFSKGKTGIKLGANIANADEQTGIFPDVSLRINLSRQAFIMELGATGNYTQQNLKYLSAINPFMNNLAEINSEKQYNFFAGLSGHLKKEVSYSAKAGYKIIKDLMLFENEFAADRSLFTTRAEDFNVVYFDANLHLAPIDKLEIDLGFTKNFYSANGSRVDDYPQDAFGLVPMLLETKARYAVIEDKLFVTSNLMAMEGVKYYDENLIINNTKLGVDFSLGVEAKLLNAIHLFASAKNIFNTEYERWYGYPGFGSNYLAGLSIQF